MAALLSVGLSYCKKTSPDSEKKRINVEKVRILIDINSATAIELEHLFGIGPVKASDIISYRRTIGGFQTIEELKNVKGIGDGKFEKIKDFITINE